MVEQSIHNQPFLVAEDLSAVGTMSLGVAIPILAALGVPTAVLPTQVLSTQTEGFGTPAKQFSPTWLTATIAHWQQEHIQLSGGLIGYVGQIELLKQLAKLVVSQQVQPLIVDPVMGDDGALYPGLTTAYVTVMQQLVTHADVITPNWTEAHLLTGTKMTAEQPDQAAISAMLSALATLCGEHTRVVITGIPGNDTILTAYQNGQTQRTVSTPRRPGHFYGSGDVFAALLSVALMRQVNFDTAVAIAVKGDTIALDQTSEAGYQRRFGMQLSQLLTWLTQKVATNLDSTC
ncbi:PfkB family carbohydrate kinase [Secundilactobacillus hailunensis]|uniref:pyridoxal kinase n=1 Tax=Secundilactobacillus hailunensis TaxID=2559923 RepID=A0ABW1T8W9_9LACO|nr:PfkB family carbohydrate kinase [Secundilactobacillus hailunensis]